MKKIIFITVATIITTTTYSQTILSLKQAKDMAMKNNTTIKNSVLEIKAAQQVKKNAFTNYFPKVSATGFAMRAKDPIVKYNMPGGNLPVYDGNPANLPLATQVAYFPGVNLQMFDKAAVGVLNVAQPLFVGGKIVNGNKLAKLGMEVKEKQQKLSQNEIMLKTEQQYWQIVSLQEKQKTVEKYEILLEDINKQVNDAYKAGLIIKNDILKVQIKQSELKANKIKLQSGKKLALMQFCLTIGVSFDSTLVLQEDFQNIELPQSYFIENETALANRTEYQLLEQSIKAQELQTKMKVGDYLPQLAVGATGYYYNSLIKDAKTTTNGLAFATISIPISDWWGGSYAIQEQKIKKEIAENTFSETKGLLKLQMEKGWMDVNVNYRQILIMEETVKQAEENLKVSKDGYNNGVVTLSELLEAQAIYTEITDKLIEAKTQYKLSITTYLQYTAR
jgi:outer membrane protein TolC